MHRSLPLLLLTACNGGNPPPDHSDGPDDPTGDSTGHSTSDTTWYTSDTGKAPSCGEEVLPPDLSTENWTQAGPLPGSGYTSMGAGTDGYPVYLGARDLGSWRADDSEFRWLELPVDKTHTYGELVVHPDDELRLFRSNGGVLWRSEDGGNNWTQLGLGNPNPGEGELSVLAVAVGAAGARVFGVLSSGFVGISHDGGDSFEEGGYVSTFFENRGKIDPPARILVDGDDGVVLIAAEQYLYRSTDGGETWQLIRSDVQDARSLIRTPDGLFVGTTGGYATSTDDGASWAEVDPGFPVDFAGWSEAGGWLFYASQGELVVDGVSRTLAMTPTMMGVAGTRLVLGWEEGVQVSDDQGATWTEASDGLVERGISVVVANPECPWMVSAGSRCTGGVYQSQDYGQTWSHDDAHFHYVMDIVHDPQDAWRMWVVNDDALYRSDDGGADWQLAYQHAHFHGFSVHPLDGDSLLIGSVGSGEFSDDRMRVYASTDGGESWSDSSTGLPETDASAHMLLHWPGNPSVVLLGTYQGGDASHLSGDGVGLYRSTDGGATWSVVESLATTDIARMSSGAGGVWAATGDGLWFSDDEGVSWARADADGWFLDVAFHGDVGLAYEKEGQAWRTDDRGVTWAPYGEGLPPIGGNYLARVSFSHDGSLAYVTPMGSGVWRIGM